MKAVVCFRNELQNLMVLLKVISAVIKICSEKFSKFEAHLKKKKKRNIFHGAKSLKNFEYTHFDAFGVYKNNFIFALIIQPLWKDI